MGIKTIVLTGGPCGGKSTGLARIEQELTERGYKVLVVPETATEIMTGGIKPFELPAMIFQDALLKIQRAKEKSYMDAAKVYAEKQNVVVLFDRGCLDAKAFMQGDDYTKLLKGNKLAELKVRDFYDGVFHLKTAADGAQAFYTLANNATRSESVEEAVAVDRSIIAAWTGHPHFRIIDNSTSFEQKIDKLMTEIYSLLGEPVPVEIERKFLVKMPNIEELLRTYNCTKVNIIQTYLNTEECDSELRLRQRGINGDYLYYLTRKKTISRISRLETEKRISQDEYLRRLMDADTNLKQIRKDRYCFVYKNNYFELDIYPFWKDKAVLEIELTSENTEVELPDFLEIIREVTEEESYKNYSLARNPNVESL